MASTAAPPAAAADAADSASSAAASSSASLRTATLEALGYVCEEMGRRDDDVLEQDAVNAVLTAVVAGMRREERDAGVRLAATRALCNALEFASSNAHCCYGALNVNDKRVITKSTHTQFICLKKFVFVTDAVLLLRGMLL